MSILSKTEGARIVTTSSIAHKTATIDFDNLNSEQISDVIENDFLYIKKTFSKLMVSFKGNSNDSISLECNIFINVKNTILCKNTKY